MAQGKKKLASKQAPKFVKANAIKSHKAAKDKNRNKPKKSKPKDFNERLYNEVEKNIRANIEEEMKIRAGKADKKSK